MSSALFAPSVHDTRQSQTARVSTVSPWAIWFLWAGGSMLYTLVAWKRYAAFRAGYWDLGFFDQAVYRLTLPGRPMLPIAGFHVLADHASVILYPISLLYRIYPSVMWLFAIQAVALASGALLVWRLARDAGTSERMSLVLGAAWLAYPAVLMPNLHDFHPEAISIPAILGVVLCVRRDRPFLFAMCLALLLSTKEAMALTAGAMGLWLLIFERRRVYGVVICIVAGAWFLIATRWIIPHFGQGHQYNSYRFLSYLGNTPGEIVLTMLRHPSIPLRQIARLSTLTYAMVLAGPVWWGLSARRLAPLLGALPCLMVNLLSNESYFQSPFYHYSMPIAPFIFLVVIATMAANAGWLKDAWKISAWIVFIIIAGALLRLHQSSEARFSAAQVAARHRLVEQIGSEEGVLTTHQLAPHLAHRQALWYVFNPVEEPALALPDEAQVKWVLLDFQEEDLRETGKFARDVLDRYLANPDFATLYANNDLYLLRRRR